MTSGERRAVSTLAGLFSLRMIGLFMIMPVFAVYGRSLSHATPFLIGLAVGIYALAQALSQIPLSQLSDRVGRKRLILAGMLLFAIGGAVAALSTNIWGVIIGRAIQGSGAISGVVMALVADLTRVEQRTKAMAVIGMSIGVSFGLAFVAGPLLAGHFGLSGLFWSTSVMGLGGMAVCYFFVPDPVTSVKQVPSTYWQQFREALAHKELVRLNWGIFSLHVILAAFFMSVPVLLKNNGGLAVSQHGWVYLPVLFLSFLTIIPAIIIAEKKRQMKGVFVSAIVMLVLSMLWLAYRHDSLVQIVVGLALFFIGFNLLEALLPSLVSKICPPGSKGTAMGIYSTSQFLGAFIGSPLGGAMSGHLSYSFLFVALAVMAGIWLWVASGMAAPPFLSSIMLSFEHIRADEAAALAQRLREVAGVEEVVVLVEEGVAYLKVDKRHLDEVALQSFAAIAAAA
jgi:MFS family permease